MDVEPLVVKKTEETKQSGVKRDRNDYLMRLGIQQKGAMWDTSMNKSLLHQVQEIEGRQP